MAKKEVAEPKNNKYHYTEKTTPGTAHAAANFGKFINYGPACPGNENGSGSMGYNDSCFKPGDSSKGGGAKVSCP